MSCQFHIYGPAERGVRKRFYQCGLRPVKFRIDREKRFDRHFLSILKWRSVARMVEGWKAVKLHLCELNIISFDRIGTHLSETLVNK